MDIRNHFPGAFSVAYSQAKDSSWVAFIMYRSGDTLRWIGYYRERQICLYHNDYFWIVEVYWYGRVVGYFRHFKEKIDLKDVEQLVRAACFFVDIFLEDKK